MYDISEAKQFHRLSGYSLFSLDDYDVQSSVLSLCVLKLTSTSESPFDMTTTGSSEKDEQRLYSHTLQRDI